jgi:hypothetical protein
MKKETTSRYKKIWPFSQSMKVKPGMSDYQKKTMVKFCRCEKAKLRSSGEKNHCRVKEIDEIRNLPSCIFAYQTAKVRKECDQH